VQIKVCNEDGCAKVQKINPAAAEGEQVVEEVEVPAGQEVTITAPEAHEPGDLEVGPVSATEEAAEEETS